MNLKTILDNLSATRSITHLSNDPLSVCHRFHDPRDREIAGLIASSFAYGNVKIILKNLEVIFSAIGRSPRNYVEQFDPAAALNLFSGFRHRFNDGRDLCALILAAKNMIDTAGSIELFFLEGIDPLQPGVEHAMNQFSGRVLAMDFSSVFRSNRIPEESYFPFLFPAPSGGSACKRLCMYLRWMVRPDDGIDLGIWKGISPAQLIIPVDAHILRIGRYIGLTARKQADWRAAKEITASLAQLDPSDPVKYDFSLCHLGISDGCGKSGRNACLTCDISGVCSGIMKN